MKIPAGYITVAEAGKRLGIGRTSVYRAVNEKLLPSMMIVKSGRTHRLVKASSLTSAAMKTRLARGEAITRGIRRSRRMATA